MSRFVTATLDGIEITRAKDVKKHGDHDQSSHGAWATGQTGTAEVSPKTIKTIIERLSETKTPGVTIDLRSGKEAKEGFICSKKGFEKPVTLDDFDANKKKVIEDYIDKNIDELSKPGAHFGGWVVKSENTVYLDVSRKFDTRQDAVRAMFDNEQEAIYDVKNDSYIYRKDEKDDRANKASNGGSANPNQQNDQRRERRFYRKNLESDRGESVDNDSDEHICLGRYGLSVKKHGEHDQSTHGAWAVGRFPKDSVPKARNGAKDYAYKKGIKQDDTIDYNKIVANRARASKIADIYESLPKVDKEAIDEYESLASEVEEQFDFLTKELGIKIEFVDEDPYKTSKEMFEDASKGVLKVLSTASTGAHPLFSDEQNDKFRAVHDYFGHAATGRGFGQDGEEAAWVHHSQMFTEKARAALTTETRGQNSFFNNRGKQFAEQKVALLPEEFWKVPVSFEKRYVAIYFDYGLKPVLKHEGHEDQSSHGNWARGYTEEERSRIESMKDKGPSLEDLDKVIGGKREIDNEEIKLLVENDSDLYFQATEDIDARVEEALARLQGEFPNHEYTEQEKTTIYENVQRDMIDSYIEDNRDDLEERARIESGDEGNLDASELTPFFEEVYGIEHTGKNESGDDVKLTSTIQEVYREGNTIEVTGVVLDDDGNEVGQIARRFFKEGDEWNVEHALLTVNDDMRGTGFGKEFIRQSEAWYTAKGMGYIYTGTAWDGARHWARSGYDFHPEQMPRNIRELVHKIQYWDEDVDGPNIFAPGTPAGKEFDSIMSRATTNYSRDINGVPTYDGIKNPRDEGFPFPVEFANIGYTSGSKDWAGKNLMAGLHMKYVKVLTAEGQKLMDGPIDHDGDGMIYDGTAREKPAPGGGNK